MKARASVSAHAALRPANPQESAHPRFTISLLAEPLFKTAKFTSPAAQPEPVESGR